MAVNDHYPNASGVPIFFHRPNGTPDNGIILKVKWDFWKLARQMIRNREERRYDTPGNVAFITYSNYKNPTLLERSYKAYAVPHIVVGRNIQQWNWYSKIITIKEYLDSETNIPEYLVITDANDVLMVNAPSRIVDLFETYSCDILLQGTFADWPPDEELSRFEMTQYPNHPLHCRLNAGGYMARTQALKVFIKEIVSGFENQKQEFMYQGKFDDQLAWRELHRRHYPRIKVDCRSLIFKRFDLFRFLRFEDGPLPRHKEQRPFVEINSKRPEKA